MPKLLAVLGVLFFSTVAVYAQERIAGVRGELHPVQQAWIEEDVPQCGYCQTGQIMSTVTFLEAFPNPTDEDINANLDNLCRCGTYYRIRKAIHKAARKLREGA